MKNKNTSWGKVANWYDKHLTEDDTYHAKVIAPNLIRLVNLKPTEFMLELGCGQGYFLEKFFSYSKYLTGVDLGSELIKIARQKNPKINYICDTADNPKLLDGKKFDVVTAILSIQNMKNLNGVVSNISRMLKRDGRVYLILNHPAFRIPQHSDWGFDETKKVQFRKVEKYMSEEEILINMNPGKKIGAEVTRSYHRPLQVYSKAFAKHNMAITKIEEWISHKESDPGPRAKAENLARKEIPMFMCLEFKFGY